MQLARGISGQMPDQHRYPRTAARFYTPYRMILPFAVVIFAAIMLGYGIDRTPIATAYTDPISKIRAQDESLYTASSLEMARRGDWLTPRFLDRYLLYKPPLLIWLSALSVRMMGASVVSVRMPALLAGICATLLMFIWIRRRHCVAAGWIAVILLISNPLWNILSRLCYTDMIYTAAAVGAIFAVAVDASIERRWTRTVFIVCCAAGILAKNVAGLLPAAVWILVLLQRGRGAWPPARRFADVAGGIVALVLPWHLYQITVHPRWFWADYVQIQLLGFGMAPPAQSSAESNLVFYARRLALTDPVLTAFALISLPALWRGIRERSAAAQLILAWIAVMGCSLLAFRYRNLPYALNLIPPLAVLAATCSPGGAWRIPVLCTALAIKSFLPGTAFSLPMRAADPIPSYQAIRDYEQMARPNDLIYVSPDDEFYSSTLDLPRVRYAFLDPHGTVVRYAPHFQYLGITMTVDQFLRGEESSRHFVERLREWGLTDANPLGTAIVAASEQELIRLAASCPHADFYLPAALAESVQEDIRQTHIIRSGAPGRVFLLAREPSVANFNPPVRVLSR